jgi:hypothetical protein
MMFCTVGPKKYRSKKEFRPSEPVSSFLASHKEGSVRERDRTDPLNGLGVGQRLEEIGWHLDVSGPGLDRPVMSLAARLDDVLG